MKIKMIIPLLVSFTLSACNMTGYGQEAGANGDLKFLQNARGGNISTCEGSLIKQNEAKSYLEKYGLPLEIKGNFICEGDKPALPRDCNGKELRSEQELVSYTNKYQLPLAINEFNCKNGIPTIPVKHIEGWKVTEKYNPTCKDAHGEKRPCV